MLLLKQDVLNQQSTADGVDGATIVDDGTAVRNGTAVKTGSVEEEEAIVQQPLSSMEWTERRS